MDLSLVEEKQTPTPGAPKDQGMDDLPFHVFLTDPAGREHLVLSHFDFDLMCSSVEIFLSSNPTREFSFVTACRLGSDGEVEEIVRWQKGSRIPLFDHRPVS
jgi:hypothetical protein